jgi:hypothetical protein
VAVVVDDGLDEVLVAAIAMREVEFVFCGFPGVSARRGHGRKPGTDGECECECECEVGARSSKERGTTSDERVKKPMQKTKTTTTTTKTKTCKEDQNKPRKIGQKSQKGNEQENVFRNTIGDSAIEGSE